MMLRTTAWLARSPRPVRHSKAPGITSPGGLRTGSSYHFVRSTLARIGTDIRRIVFGIVTALAGFSFGGGVWTLGS